jgi:hypothetical protein
METSQQPRLVVYEPTGPRRQLPALARPILIIPHVLLVGGPFVGLGGGGTRMGALGLLAATITLLDWVAILVTGRPLAGLQALKRLYLRWRARVLAYGCFLRDEYPPFGDDQYPVEVELPEPPARHDRLLVALRPLLLIPHVVILAVLLVAAFVVAVISWFSLGVFGRLDPRLWRFSRDVMAYVLRVECYALLLSDHFPPFALRADDDLSTPVSPAATLVRP